MMHCKAQMVKAQPLVPLELQGDACLDGLTLLPSR